MLLESILVLTISFFLLYYKFLSNQKLVKGFKGPNGLPIVGNAFEIGQGNIAKRLVPYLETVVKEYGPRTKFFIGWRPNAILSAAEDVETILGSSVHVEKGREYEYMKDWLGNGLVTASGEKWHKQRKLLTPAFHYKVLEGVVPAVDEQAKLFVSILKQKMEKNQTQIKNEIGLLAMDVVCETAMGLKVNAQLQADPVYVNALNNVASLTLSRCFKPWLHPAMVWKLSSVGKKASTCLKIIHGLTSQVIAEKKKKLAERKKAELKQLKISNEDEIGTNQKPVFLDLLLGMQEENPEKLSDQDIIYEVATVLFGGQDTVATVLKWAILVLGNHPTIQMKVQRELQDIFVDDITRKITIEDTRRMEYLELVIKETLRMYPVVPAVMRQIYTTVQLAEGAILEPGVTAWIFIKHLHYNSKYWQSPDEFIPERFTTENSKGRHPYTYIPFSSGPRNCIGQKFAMMELKIILANVFRKFCVRSMNSLKDTKTVWEVVLIPEDGVQIELTLR